MSIEPASLALAVLVALASGMVGSFALMRRMTLAGDALSHVALPGIGIALLYSFNPVFGGAIALLAGAFLIWKVERLTPLNTEAIIGVLFSLSLAVGAIAIKEEHELIETLFGGITAVTFPEFLFGMAVGAFVIWFIFVNRHALVLTLVSRELAKTARISVERLQLYFLFTFALTVIIGMKFLGILLMGALIIIPAAAARNVARSLNGMLVCASGISLISVVSGLFVSAWLGVQPGPAIIIIAGMLFVATLLFHLTEEIGANP